ncbi:hypothetical protein AXG89_27235 (plasmid) [Burkholderia sp. PAMC 26561]|nr:MULTISPECIES: hypothetical protein [Burkholderiaceae]AME27243.1 hypothetical protein AXG89_25450 [Burkholderia sp. PAMC 26561]AME27605.1 hypothetical protein AXG89_27235 [Burkholderia sp. PAMC 26561]
MIHRSAAKFGNHPFADRNNQAGLLGKRDEFRRRDRAERWIEPSNQGFHRRYVTCQDVDLRLEIQTEFVIANGASQILRY